jgi:hypothetical protein
MITSEKLRKELQFIEESLKAGIISDEEYSSAKKRIQDKLKEVQKQEEELRVEEKIQAEAEKEALKDIDKVEPEKTAIREEDDIKPEVYYDDKQPEEPEKEQPEEEIRKEPEYGGAHIPKEEEPEPEKVVPPKKKPPKKKPKPKKKRPLKFKMPSFNLSFPHKSKILVWLAIMLLASVIIVSIYYKFPEKEKFIPLCSFDLQCQKQGFFGRCVLPGTRNATCVFEDAVSLNITIITSGDCIVCDTSRMQNTLKQLYPGAGFNVIDAEEAGDLLKELKISALPAYIFDSTVATSKRYEATASVFTKSTMVKNGGYYVMKAGAAGSHYFFKNEEKKNSVALFIDPFSPTSMIALGNLLEFAEKRSIPREIKYYTRSSYKDTNDEITELFRQVCIRENTDKLVEYLYCLHEDEITEESRAACIGRFNLAGPVVSCINSNDALELLKADLNLAIDFSINSVPVFIFNNQYKKGGSLSVELLDEMYCTVNPESC